MPRPRKHLRARDYDRVEAMASVGASEATIAKRLGIASRTFKRILDRDERAAAALEAGHGQLETDLVRCLLEAAKKGNVVAAIYLTKARCGYTDQPQPKPEESRVRIELTLPQPLSREEHERLAPIYRKQLPEVIDVESR